MKIEELLWDVFEIKGALEDDSDLEETWVLYKLNQYRAVFIPQEYAITQQINPVWLQRVHKFSWEKVTAADDPAIVYNSVTLGKYTIPRVISLPDDQGTYRISGSGAIQQFEPIDFNLMMMKADVGEESHGEYGYYTKIGDVIYIRPYIMEGSAVIIAENPLNVPILDPLTGLLRGMLFTDEYPLDGNLAQRSIIEFLTKDMAISEATITDIINDSQSQLKILKDEQARRVSKSQ